MERINVKCNCQYTVCRCDSHRHSPQFDNVRKPVFKWVGMKSGSGQRRRWVIDSSELTQDDLDTLAKVVASTYPYFDVNVVSEGGERFARALRENTPLLGAHILLVDDVLRSDSDIVRMYKAIDELKLTNSLYVLGIVIFSQIQSLPSWIKPLFILTPEFSPL